MGHLGCNWNTQHPSAARAAILETAARHINMYKEQGGRSDASNDVAPARQSTEAHEPLPCYHTRIHVQCASVITSKIHCLFEKQNVLRGKYS